MPPIEYSSFHDDTRANRVDGHIVVHSVNNSDARRWLGIDGPIEAVRQVADCAGQACRSVPSRSVSFEGDGRYNHLVEFAGDVPWPVEALMRSLRGVLLLKLPLDSPVDHAIALDFYKIPDAGLPADEWPNSEVGGLISRAKYYKDPNVTATCGRALAARMVAAIDANPLLEPVPNIVSIPGHRADGMSFGERLAATVARDARKGLVQLRARSGPRAEAKGDASGTNLDEEFYFAQEISGAVILVDDVYHSGTSMRGAALAVRRAGADKVFALVGARTLRR